MRDYKRKAKIKDSNEWVIGYHVYVDYLDKHYILVSEKIYCGFSGMLAMKQYEVDGDTICNPTGLTDKNGNKIWENDVVKTYNSQGQECHIEQIIWADYGLNEGWCSKGIKSLIKYDKRVFNTGFGKSDARKCEVIGNIFDNANLLKGE